MRPKINVLSGIYPFGEKFKCENFILMTSFLETNLFTFGVLSSKRFYRYEWNF